ncbi:hypothetical protein [Sphingobacterium lactis]|uniref:hypothetical protein n=1 Tax=Sphingobacterium lactis TaxID=797291 RepID=UPI003DA3EE64
MSSHHIVRENQEPALFIADPHCLQEGYLHQLLEWSPTIITLAQHYEHLQSLQIKVDVLLAKEEVSGMDLEEHLQVVSYGDSSPTAALFTYLHSKNNYAVNILTNDEQISSYIPFLSDFTIILLNDRGKHLLVRKYEKWLPKGFVLGIAGLEDITDLENLEAISDGKFTVRADGFVRITEQPHYFRITEEL